MLDIKKEIKYFVVKYNIWYIIEFLWPLLKKRITIDNPKEKIVNIEKISIEQIEKLDCAFTHGGVFHSDDVFSAALLKIINPDIKIIRGFKVPDNFAGLVFDIGGGAYDHHQMDNEIRENGIPYASFGKLWRCREGDKTNSDKI